MWVLENPQIQHIPLELLHIWLHYKNQKLIHFIGRLWEVSSANSCKSPFLFCSFSLSSLTQTNFCLIWIPQTSPAIATMTFCRSLKTTERLSDTHTHKLLPIAWSFPEKPWHSVLDQHKDALPFSSSSCTIYIRQRRLTAKNLKETQKTRQDLVELPRPSTSCGDTLDCAAIVDFIFTPHTCTCAH